MFPQPSRISVLKDGQEVGGTAASTKLRFPPQERGTYRVEVYLDSLGAPFNRLPWIISNPIYVR